RREGVDVRDGDGPEARLLLSGGPLSLGELESGSFDLDAARGVPELPIGDEHVADEAAHHPRLRALGRRTTDPRGAEIGLADAGAGAAEQGLGEGRARGHAVAFAEAAASGDTGAEGVALEALPLDAQLSYGARRKEPAQRGAHRVGAGEARGHRVVG